MARSNKPIVWLPFAAGGTLAAFLLPVIILMTLLAATGVAAFEQIFAFERMRDFVAHPLGKLILMVVLGLCLWHAAHRLRMTVQDLGVRQPRARTLIARLCYGVATVVTLFLLYSLWLTG